MNEDYEDIIKKYRDFLFSKGYVNLSLSQLSLQIGVEGETVSGFFSSEEELVEKVLEYERKQFERIFQTHDFEGVNAIEILLTVSREVALNFPDVSPSITFELKNHYPEIYQKHFDFRRDFIYEKIKINLKKGINQGIYRDDLSIELVARLYLSRLIDLHNPDFFPSEEFSFETIFNTMFENFIRGIAKPEGLAYFERRKKEYQL
jgi:TetR/AcrR family transcriptional regulator, cholesterol catabolism regulator